MSMENNSPAQMSLWEDHPARASVSQETDWGFSTTATYGLQCLRLSGQPAHAQHLWRMCLEAFQADLSTQYAPTWKLRDTTAARFTFQLQLSERHTNAIEFSSSAFWPTPSASDTTERQPSPTPVMTRNGTIRHQNETGQQSFMRTSQVVKLWSTPQNRDWRTGSPPSSPRIKRKQRLGYSLNVNDQVLQWSTPAAQDAKNLTLPASQRERDTLPGDIIRNDHAGYLNPDWVELLMGLPAGWTSLHFQGGPQGRAYTSIITSHRARRRAKRRITNAVSRHSAMRSSGSRRTQLRGRWLRGYKRKMKRQAS